VKQALLQLPPFYQIGLKEHFLYGFVWPKRPRRANKDMGWPRPEVSLRHTFKIHRPSGQALFIEYDASFVAVIDTCSFHCHSEHEKEEKKTRSSLRQPSQKACLVSKRHSYKLGWPDEGESVWVKVRGLWERVWKREIVMARLGRVCYRDGVRVKRRVCGARNKAVNVKCGVVRVECVSVLTKWSFCERLDE